MGLPSLQSFLETPSQSQRILLCVPCSLDLPPDRWLWEAELARVPSPLEEDQSLAGGEREPSVGAGDIESGV